MNKIAFVQGYMAQQGGANTMQQPQEVKPPPVPPVIHPELGLTPGASEVPAGEEQPQEGGGAPAGSGAPTGSGGTPMEGGPEITGPGEMTVEPPTITDRQDPSQPLEPTALDNPPTY